MTVSLRKGFVALGLVAAAGALSGCTISTCTTAQRLGVIPNQDYATSAPQAAPIQPGYAAPAAAAPVAGPPGQPSSQVFTFLPPTQHPNVNNWPGAHTGERAGVSGGGQ